MKKIISIISFLIIFYHPIYPQTYFGWITDTHIGYPNSEADLENVVRDINSKKEIKFVIITGDITEQGNNEQLTLAKKILDSLTVPYHIIPGNHDTKWSESGFTKFQELWGDDKFAFEQDGVKYIGLNSGIPWQGGGGHISVEDLAWLSKTLAATKKTEHVILSLHHKLDDDIDNWFEVTNLLSSHNVYAVLVGDGHTNKLMNFNGIPAVMSRAAINKDNNSWGYTLVENKADSLLFFEITNDSIPKYWGAIAKGYNKIPKIDSLQFINYTLDTAKTKQSIKAEVLWSKNLKSSMFTLPSKGEDRVYAATRQGIIYCFDTEGKLLWQYTTGGAMMSSPVEYNNILIAATLQGDLLTIDAGSGKLIQVIGLGEPLTSQLITIDAVYNNKYTRAVVVGTANGNLYCYDIYSLEMIWESNSSKGLIEDKPLFINNRIIFGSWDNFLYCIDARSGSLYWKWSENKNFYYSPAVCSPVTDGKYIFISTPDKYVSAIDLLLGTTVWRKANLSGWESLGINEKKDRLYIKSSRNIFSIAAAGTGKLIKKIDLEFGLDTTPAVPLEWDNNIIFSSKNGKVYLIDSSYKWTTLFFLGTARLNSIVQLKNNVFAVSNIDGKIFIFNLK